MAVAFVKNTALFEGLEVSSLAPTITGVTAGSLLVCTVVYSPSATTASAVPTPAGGWSVAQAPTSSFGTAYAPRSAIFYKENAASGSHTATFTLPAGSYISASISEYSGVSTSSALDVSANSLGTSTTGTTATTATSTVADSVVVCVAQAEASDTSPTPTTGYTNLGNGSDMFYSPAYKVVAATGAQSATWAWTESGFGGRFSASIAVFKGSAAGGTSLTPGQDTVSLSGHAPTVARTSNQSLSPAQDTVSIAGFPATVARTAHQSLIPGQDIVSLSGHAPTVSQTANQALAPSHDAVSITGFAPTIDQTGGVVLSPGVESVALSGFDPAVERTSHQWVSPAQDSVTIAGFAPTVLQASGSPSVYPAPVVFDLSGLPPSVSQSVSTPIGGGPFSYAHSHAYAREQRERKKREKWAEEERAITERMKPKKKVQLTATQDAFPESPPEIHVPRPPRKSKDEQAILQALILLDM